MRSKNNPDKPCTRVWLRSGTLPRTGRRARRKREAVCGVISSCPGQISPPLKLSRIYAFACWKSKRRTGRISVFRKAPCTWRKTLSRSGSNTCCTARSASGNVSSDFPFDVGSSRTYRKSRLAVRAVASRLPPAHATGNDKFAPRIKSDHFLNVLNAK